ncbi:MAG: Synechococcus phage, partial [Planctomycetota bacterium]
MIFNWKLETFRRLFGLKRSNKAVTKKLNIENLEERIECATKVWNGSLAGVGTDGSLSPFSYGTDGDPTFSTYMAAISGNNGLNQITNSLGDNWNAQFGQRALPNNGDTLVFPQLYLTINGNSASLITPINGVFGDLTRTDLDATVPTPPRNPPGPIFVNVINDLMPDSNGNLAGYLRDQVTGANFVNPLIYVDQILLSGTGYAIYGRDNPQFGPTNSKISPPHYFVGGETVSAEFFYPGAAASSNVFQDPYFKPSQWTGQVVYVDPATYNPLTNISYNPAIPLNIQTQIVADYLTTGLPANSTINFSNDSPIYPAIATGANPSNANWIYMPMNIGNPNLPEGSAFVFNVTQEGGWLILDSDLHETSTNNTDGNYTLLNDVNNNKILKQGRGILVFESNNQFTGLVSIQDGMVIVSDSEGLGSAFTNSNVEVFDGTLSLSSDQFGIGSIQATGQPNVQGDSYSTTNISNRNLILNGGDGFLPTLNSSTTPVGVPLGQFSGQSGIYGRAHQWNGTVALNTNPSEITQASLPGDQFGNDGTFSIGSIQVTSGGTGYDPLNPPVVQIQAPNSAFAGQAVLQDGGIASIPLLTGGSGYGIAPTVNITGDGTGATANATLTNGVVTAIVITNPGTGYTYAPSVSISAPGGAIAGTPVVTNGQITQIPIQNGGSGYVNSPVVIITDNPTQGTPAGTGATATAILTNGVVTSINITNPGTGYTNPTVTIGLVGAIAGTPVITNSQITQIPLNGNGFGYSSLPLISISGPGNGATALAVAGAVSGTPANPNGDPSVGQEFGSATEINGVISGAAGLRKWGMGVVEVTQANTFSGDVVIFDGALNIQNNLGLGVSNNIQNGVVVPKNVYVRELPSNLVPQNQLLSHMGALTLGDETNGGQNLVFDTGYQLIIQDGGNAGTTNATGPDQNPGSNSGLTNTSGARVEGLGAFQVVSPNDNPNSAEWQGNVVVQTNAAIGGTPNSNLKISGVISATGQANNLITLEKRGSMNLSVSANNADTSNVNGNFVGNWLISNGNLKVENNGALGFAGTNSNNSSYVWVRQQSQVLPGLSGAGSLQMVGDGLNISNNIVLES